MTLNATARLVVGAGEFDHVTPVLRDVRIRIIHWLPVRQRIQFKIALTILLTISAALVQRISRTSAFHWPTSVDGQTSIQLNVETDIWRATDKNSARSLEFSRCITSRLECPSCLPPFNIHQSRTIQSCSWKPISSIKPTTSSEVWTFLF